MTNEEILREADKIVDAAGAAGGIDEVARIAERGWPDESLAPDLRAAVQAEAKRRISEQRD